MMLRRIRGIYRYLEIVPRLGTWNVLYVLYYRLMLRSGFLLRRYPVQAVLPGEAVFSEAAVRGDFPEAWKEELLGQAEDILKGRILYYSHHRIMQSSPPDWFLNPFNGKQFREASRHWTRIPDFDPRLGDIKNLWEASRFSWLGTLARAYVVSGNRSYLDTLNLWLADWISKNPVNQGPNWKCGQESSYRVLALLNAALVLDQVDKPTGALLTYISVHLNRISSNLRYARAQRNNHATSEAAALYVGGNFLLRAGAPDRQRNRRHAEKGRKALESLVGKLTYRDGSFSQHSVVYHRLFLDTLITVLIWRERLNLEEFSPALLNQAKKATRWLRALCDESGQCPNLGSNDGTLLLNNHSCDYRDFRPSLQLAKVCLEDRVLFPRGKYDEALYWFGKYRANRTPGEPARSSEVFPSGYVVMMGENSWALLRFPNYKFRPAHNDALHFDLWAGGRNLLMDSGSYSYHPDTDSPVPDLKSVHAHNTLSFDRMEQMPRLGRFLLGKWLKMESTGQLIQSSGYSGSWEGSYRDSAGNTHHRRILWNRMNWELEDRFTGDGGSVEIGFNFEKCAYELDQKSRTLKLPWGRLRFSENATMNIIKHYASMYYNESQEVLRVVASSKNNSEVRTSIFINQ